MILRKLYALLFLIAFLVGSFSYAQTVYYPTFKDSAFHDPQEGFAKPASGSILRVSGHRYDLTVSFTNFKVHHRLSRNWRVLSRFDKVRFRGAAPNLYDGESFYPTQIFNSPLRQLDEDRYIQWQSGIAGTELRIYNLKQSSLRESGWPSLSFLNQNLVYLPPYAYFLGQRNTPYLQDSTGARAGLNERFINTDSLYLLRLHAQSLKLDTLSLFKNPTSWPYKTLAEELGYLKYNASQSTVEHLTHYDTLRTYKIGQRNAVSEKLFLKKPHPNKSLRAWVREHLFLSPGDTVYQRIYWEGRQNPMAVVPYAINAGNDQFIFDTLNLPTSNFYIDQESNHFPIIIKNYKNRVYMTVSGRTDPLSDVQVHLFCYPKGSSQMLWKQVLLKDSVRNIATDMQFSAQGDLWLAATVYGSPTPNSEFYSNRTAVMLRHNIQALASAQKENISLYPNPSGEMVFFQSQKAWSSIDLISVSGKKIGTYQYQPGEILNIPVNDLRSGLYLLQMRNDQGDLAVRKLMVR